jgi:ADP-heptose:LPS heptosyltransferase
MWVDVIRRLHGRNWDVVLLGTPDSLKFKGNPVPGIHNCTTDKLTFRQSAAVLSTANVFLGPDSSLIHVAGALGTPALGLFSVVPWQLRTKYCPTTFVIQAEQGCDIAPCFHAPRTPSGFPSYGPCAKTGRCEALGSIEPEQIVAKLESMV